MKILVVSQYYFPEPFRINEICEELVRRGHEVTVITSQPNYPDGDIYEGYPKAENPEILNGVTIYRCNVRPRKKGHLNLLLNYLDFLIRGSIKAGFLKEKFDSVYTYQLSPISSSHPAIIYGKRHHVPVLLYCLDLWPESIVSIMSCKGFLYKVLKKYSSYIYKNATSIIVTTPSFKAYLSDLTKLPTSCILFIPQHSQDVGKPNDNQLYNERKSSTNIMFLGNIGETQNLDLLIQAAVKLKEDKQNFYIHIVGSGSYYHELIKLVQKYGVDDHITFYGRLPKEKMPYYYGIADVCYLSLRDEGLVSYTIPGKLQEYMSAGKAVVASIKGDAATVINEAKCGIVVNNSDVDALVDALKIIISDKEKQREFGKKARQYYLEHFTLKHHVDQLEMKLLSLLSEQK